MATYRHEIKIVDGWTQVCDTFEEALAAAKDIHREHIPAGSDAVEIMLMENEDIGTWNLCAVFVAPQVIEGEVRQAR